MSRVVITAGAAKGLERCRQFLIEKNPQAMKRAGIAIERQLSLLEIEPEIGRPFDDASELRELLIPFGDSGYVALYRYELKPDVVYILALRHQKEAGY